MQFSKDERIELRGLLRSELSLREIAKILGRDPGSISREVVKGGGRKNYSVSGSQRMTQARRMGANQQHRKLGKDSELTNLVLDLLELDWSPEQIVGRMRYENLSKITSFSAIYSYINPRPDLAKLLPRKHNKYRRKHGIADREQRRRDLEKKRNIATREEVVNARIRLGDWEGDTIVGKERKERILTHVERKSRYLLASITANGEATEVRKATEQDFKTIPGYKKQTITLDNGVEFAEWELTEKHINTTIFFANPYHSWERGTNENTNGLLRRYFPKGTAFATLKPRQLKEAVTRLNHRPRKCLGYRTPHEVFHDVTVLQFER